MSNRICLTWLKHSFNTSPAEPGYTLPNCKQCRSEEANWSGSALFAIKYVNVYQKFGSSNLIGRKLEVGVASSFIQHDKG